LIFLAGHPILSEGHFIDISDFHSGQIDLKRFLVPGGQVFLYSCSNGKGGEDADNLANAVVQVSPKGTRIYSSRVIGNIRSLTVQDDLALKVEWSEGEPYNPIKGLQPF